MISKYNGFVYLYYMDNHIEVLSVKRENRDIRKDKASLIAIVISCILTFMFSSLFTYTIIIHWEYTHIFFFAFLGSLMFVLISIKCFCLEMNYSLVIDKNGVNETFWNKEKKMFKWSDVKYIAFYEKGALVGVRGQVPYSACVISTVDNSTKKHMKVVKHGVSVGILEKLPKGYIAVYGENAELTKELYEKIQDYIPDDVKKNIVFEVD